MVGRLKYVRLGPRTELVYWQRYIVAVPSLAIAASSPRSAPLRENEIAYFLNVDFVTHVALVAVEEGGRGGIVGGGRYIVVQPGKAEVAFFVVDQCQGQGIGAALMRHLASVALKSGLKQLSAEVLADNISMMRVFEKCGLRLNTTREGSVVHVTLQLL